LGGRGKCNIRVWGEGTQKKAVVEGKWKLLKDNNQIDLAKRESLTNTPPQKQNIFCWSLDKK